MRSRFFRAATVAILAGLLIAFLFAVPLMEQLYTDQAEQQVVMALSLSIGYPVENDAYSELAATIGHQLAESDPQLRLTIIRTSGEVVGDSQSTPNDMDNHLERPEVAQALAHGEGRDIRNSHTVGERQLYRARRCTLDNGDTLVYRVSMPLKGIGQVRGMLWGCGLIGIFMGLVAALFAVRYAAGRLLEPLQSLTRAARATAAGESVHVGEAPGEIGELASAFNRMSDRLTAAHRELAHSNDQLASVLQGMDDGVVAIDAGGTVTLLTRRAQLLLGECPATLKRLSEGGVNAAFLLDCMKRAMDSGTPVRETWTPAGPPERILQVYAARIGEQETGGALAVMSDVTRLCKLECMRSEFAANVTHELKTPLTSIRGYIELLKSGPRDEETSRMFYEIIEIEAERLQRLTDDLLQLSEIENAPADSDVPLTSVAQTAARVEESLRPEAEQRQIAWILNIPAALGVRVHAHRLYQLLKNLMENAVKYNRDGGTVTLEATLEKSIVVLRVRDTGIGIPAEHLERVFERFYRVDKGRSREQGGTGLGLSIVKHIVSLYGGDVQVDSIPGEGSVFTVRVPGGLLA